MKNILAPGFILILLISGYLTSCQKQMNSLKAGIWKGSLIVRKDTVPFLFEVKGSNPDSTSVTLINGEDRFEVKKVIFNNDSVTIPVELYDVQLTGKITGQAINGRFIKKSANNSSVSIPFFAEYGNLQRFPVNVSSKLDFSLKGTWDVNITSSSNTTKTIGNFDQNGSKITGSILDPSGDYRFFEGVVQDKKFVLSAFGGSTPYLIKGDFLNDTTFSGEFVTLRQTLKLQATRNPNAKMPDPYSGSHLKDGYSALSFTFPNLEGKKISLSDPEYQGKVVIVTILGSWCPNCLDENAFLAGWYKENHKRGIEVIGLGFERKDDFESAKKSLSALKTRLGIDYEILFAGKSGTESASKALPALNGISAFPTTIFIDKKGNVRKVHTGFNGPATGKFYTDFKLEFNHLIDELVAE